MLVQTNKQIISIFRNDISFFPFYIHLLIAFFRKFVVSYIFLLKLLVHLKVKLVDDIFSIQNIQYSFPFFLYFDRAFYPTFYIYNSTKSRNTIEFQFLNNINAKGDLFIYVYIFIIVVWTFKSKSYDIQLNWLNVELVLCGIYNFYLEIPFYFF